MPHSNPRNTPPYRSESVYPRWLVVTMGINLLSLLLSPFFLFGGISPISSGAIGHFLGFVAVNLFWVIPCLCFFFSLDIWGKGHKILGIGIGIGGIAVMLAGAWYLWTLL